MDERPCERCGEEHWDLDGWDLCPDCLREALQEWLEGLPKPWGD